MLRLWRRRRAAEIIDLQAIGVDPAHAGFAIKCTDDDGNPVWPDDPDEVPGWMPERQAWRAANGIPPLPYRTRREMESAVLAIVERLERRSESRLVGPFTPELAASRFLNALRASSPSETLEFNAAELSAAYADYCTDNNIAPTHIDQVKAVMAMMPGVDRQKSRSMIDGKRRQVVCWLIQPIEPHIDANQIDGDDEVDLADTFDEPIRLAA